MTPANARRSGSVFATNLNMAPRPRTIPSRAANPARQQPKEDPPDPWKGLIVKHAKFWRAAAPAAIRTYRTAKLNTRIWRSLPNVRSCDTHMQAMVLNELRTPLKLTELAEPLPGPNEVRVKVGACGVCRTDLHVVDGDLPGPKLP